MRLEWVLALCGLCAMYGPSFWELMHGIWLTDAQGQGPLVLVMGLWLISRERPWTIVNHDLRPVRGAWLLLVAGGFLYAFGRSQGIYMFEIGSFLPIVAAVLWINCGVALLKKTWFAFFFMLFMIPLPGPFVDAVTQPMKLAVSYVAETILYDLGYPISRAGVTLQIGQYQLLVADACAGLNTLFTLEAVGLLYLNVVRYSSLVRNVVLGVLIIPISFCANVIRVMALILITYYFGDAAGRGFLHGFAGIVLFVCALLLIIAVDSALRAGIRFRNAIGEANGTRP